MKFAGIVPGAAGVWGVVQKAMRVAGTHRSGAVRACRPTVTLLVAWFACGAVVIDAEGRELTVNVHLDVDRAITSTVLTRVLESEATGIWKPYGVRLVWNEAAGSTAHGLQLVAMLEARFGRGGLPPSATVLGRSSIDLESPILRPIHVSFDATDAVLTMGRSLPETGRQIVHDHELARALGRVLAHELGHVLLGAPYHDAEGLMRAVYRPSELADPDRAQFRLTCMGVGRLRNRLRVLGFEDEGLDGIGSDRPGRGPCIPGHAQ
jgi:hypothetical protein